MKNITVIILAKNEESNIGRALNSARFAGEILVVDDGSTDKTIELARDAGASVLKASLNNDFGFHRNVAMKSAKNDWILFLDADEELTPELVDSIQGLAEEDTRAGYYLKRRDYWWGKELHHGETKTARTRGIMRLVNRTRGAWVGTVHETYHAEGSTGSLAGFINHYPHQTLAEFISSVNAYSTLRAKELYKAGLGTGIGQIVLFPFLKFMLTYFFYLGFLDGPAGFVYAFLMSFHSFLVRAKLYQYTRLSGDKS